MLTAPVPRRGSGSTLRHLVLAIAAGGLLLLRMFLAPLIAQEDSAPITVSDRQSAGEVETSSASSVSHEEPIHVDVRTSSFQEVTPGKTTLEEVRIHMGEPLDEEVSGAERVLVYQVGPFPQVEMIVIDQVVDSIVVYLKDSARPQDIATELGLDDFAPASIYNDAGEPIGMVYPERGVAFSFKAQAIPAKVEQLVLSPIASEFFVLRAQDDADWHYERRIADANYALRLAPDNAQAHWCKARVLLRAGLYERALVSCENALNLAPANLDYRLTWADLQHRLEQHEDALAEIESVLDEPDLSALTHARAEALLGNLLSEGPRRDYEQAMQHHLKAVEIAAPLASSPKRLLRREARHFLVEVHLAVANDITRGGWSAKKETAPKWLRTARSLADKLIAEDAGDERVKLLLLQKALSCYVGMRGAVDPTEVIQQALQTGKNLTDSAKDVYREREIQWLLVDALADAARIEQMRGKTDHVQEYAEEAIKLLKVLASSDESRSRSDRLVGLLNFYVGSTFAIQDNDHHKAVRWYEKAMPYLSRSRPSQAFELGRHGQRFVSMGVSYWEANVRDEGIRLTEDGLEMMLSASDAGKLNKDALAVPYGNLSAMYQAVGRGEEAEKLAAKAALLEDEKVQQR